MRSVLREEKKFLIQTQERARLESGLSGVMILDKHNGPVGYMVRSLYFDTPEDRDFHGKEDGLEIRRKIRLRIYHPADDYAMLEIKQKQGAYQKKRSLRMTREDAIALTDGDRSVLMRYQEPFAKEVYCIMSMECYLPKAIVEYDRKAFIAKENSIRITFDSGMRATESNYDIFSDSLNMYPVFPKTHTVLEVKFNGFLLSYIKELINRSQKSELSVSKYCLARSVTLHYSYA